MFLWAPVFNASNSAAAFIWYNGFPAAAVVWSIRQDPPYKPIGLVWIASILFSNKSDETPHSDSEPLRTKETWHSLQKLRIMADVLTE